MGENCSRQCHSYPSCPPSVPPALLLWGNPPDPKGKQPGPLRTHWSLALPLCPFPTVGTPCSHSQVSGHVSHGGTPAGLLSALSLLGIIPLGCAALVQAVPALPNSREGSSSLSRAQAQRHSNYLLCLCLAWPPFLELRLACNHCFLREMLLSPQALLSFLENGKETAGSDENIPDWEWGRGQFQEASLVKGMHKDQKTPRILGQPKAASFPKQPQHLICLDTRKLQGI